MPLPGISGCFFAGLLVSVGLLGTVAVVFSDFGAFTPPDGRGGGGGAGGGLGAGVLLLPGVAVLLVFTTTRSLPISSS